MPRPPAVKHTNLHQFGKLEAAREFIRQRAEEIVNLYLENARKAQDAGDYQTAAKSLQWLLEHIPANPGEQRVIDPSVDKQQVAAQKDTGPKIQIGIQVGGTARDQKALPVAKVIDVKPE